MKKIILATITLLFFSVPLYAEEFEDDEDEALYEAKERVEEARQLVNTLLEESRENRRKATGGGDPWLTSYYNKWTNGSDNNIQQAMDMYKVAVQQYQIELELARARKAYRNTREKVK